MDFGKHNTYYPYSFCKIIKAYNLQRFRKKSYNFNSNIRNTISNFISNFYKTRGRAPTCAQDQQKVFCWLAVEEFSVSSVCVCSPLVALRARVPKRTCMRTYIASLLYSSYCRWPISWRRLIQQHCHTQLYKFAWK